VIEAVGLSKIYNRSMPNEVRAVEDVSLGIEEGRIVALTGPSGCGKTTILSMLGLILTPTSGEIIIDGERVLLNSDTWKTGFRRENFGFIFQHINLLYRNTAMENVLLPLYSFDSEPGSYTAKAQELFEKLGLKDRAGRMVETLSGGEQQRVAFVRALIKDPKYIFADEPTVFVDEETSKVIYKIFSSLRDAGKTVIMSTHDAELLKIADNVHRMSVGRLSSH
jgi:ABC-type lipoprotein export system ATPase subunit